MTEDEADEEMRQMESFIAESPRWFQPLITVYLMFIVVGLKMEIAWLRAHNQFMKWQMGDD